MLLSQAINDDARAALQSVVRDDFLFRPARRFVNGVVTVSLIGDTTPIIAKHCLSETTLRANNECPGSRRRSAIGGDAGQRAPGTRNGKSVSTKVTLSGG